MERYKELERAHYDAKAQQLPSHGLDLAGSAAIEEAVREPYIAFERSAGRYSFPGATVVDLGAGTGIHSLVARDASIRIAADISGEALRMARERGRRADLVVTPLIADAEQMPLADGCVDLVTSAGALYCFDFDNVCREILRVLKPGGAWVFVDSWDANPLYRANRRIGRARGRRTELALENIPDAATLERLGQRFDVASVRYFGVFAFVAPVLRPLIGGSSTARVVSKLDRLFPRLHRYAFKIVVEAIAPAPRRDAAPALPRTPSPAGAL
ncbi:MAG TPA: class I SAM-dependent methyltransferase [Gemmatimonadaceae bacterium]|nr:class I SAM-dependent methyltransferase [Gemmatimonadaceae bacterium]